MGILVPEANLPMGLPVSNVYISFSEETIYVSPRKNNNNFMINTFYKVYTDPTKTSGSNIRIPIVITVTDFQGKDVYSLLYDELKMIYPGSEDILDT